MLASVMEAAWWNFSLLSSYLSKFWKHLTKKQKNHVSVLDIRYTFMTLYVDVDWFNLANFSSKIDLKNKYIKSMEYIVSQID